MYAELYDQVGRERFEAAYDWVLKTSKFRPDISELREAAGARLKSRAEIDQEAAENALADTLRTIRKHSWQLRTIPGAVIRDRDENGLIMNRADWVREPETVPPVLDQRVVDTVRALGTGDFWTGMRRLATHPAAQGREDEPTHPAEVKRIEDRWSELYKRMAESLAA